MKFMILIANVLEKNSNSVSTNDALAAACLCNTNVIFLGDSTSLMYYLCDYLVKDPVILTTVLNLCRVASREIVKRPSVAVDTGTPMRTVRHLLTRMLNKCAGGTETSGAIAALSLLEYPSTVCSHTFWFCYTKRAVADVIQRKKDFFKSYNEKAEKELSHCAYKKDKFGTIIYNDIDKDYNIEDDDIVDIIEENEDTIVDEEEKEVENEDFYHGYYDAVDEEEDNNDDIKRIYQHNSYPMGDESLDLFAISASGAEGTKVGVIPHQHVLYLFRGEKLANYSLYEYSGIVVIHSLETKKGVKIISVKDKNKKKSTSSKKSKTKTTLYSDKADEVEEDEESFIEKDEEEEDIVEEILQDSSSDSGDEEEEEEKEEKEEEEEEKDITEEKGKEENTDVEKKKKK